MKLSKQKVRLDIGGTDVLVTRTIHNVSDPQYILSWTGRKYYKWIGYIRFFGVEITVWGYSGSKEELPEKWGNTGT